MENVTVIFKNKNCKLQLRKLNDFDPPSIRLLDPVDFSLVAIATADIPIPDVNLEPEEVLIVDCLENKGMLDSLIASNVVSYSGKDIDFSVYSFHICKLLIKDY